jgi:hypothetical protein
VAKNARAVDNSVLERWRALDAQVVLAALAEYAKQDSTFKPVKSQATSRWHAKVDGAEYELLLTGQRFWDSRARSGGGGAVDLVMHLAQTDFPGAVRRLKALGL